MESIAQSSKKVPENRVSKGERDFILYLEKIFPNQILFLNLVVVPFITFPFPLLNLGLLQDNQNSPRRPNRSCGYRLASKE
jgi:hypothetical protein